MIRSLCFVVLAVASPSYADYLEELRRGNSEQAAADLVNLAEWCKGKKLYSSRLELYKLILELDTDHKLARRKLRFVRGKGGKWVRRRPLHDTRDRAPELHGEHQEKRREIAAKFAASLVVMIRKSGTTTPEATRERVLREIFLLDPEHASARAANEETKVGSRWVLKETVAAKLRRRMLRKRVVKLILQHSAPKAVKPTEEEKSYGVVWKATLQGTYWRMLYSADAFEAIGCLRIADSTEGLFETVFDMGGVYFAGRRLLITDEEAKYLRVLQRCKKMTKKGYERGKQLGSTWLPESRTCVCKMPFVEWRIEISARQPLGLLLDEYFDLSTRHGWVWEGVGLYLTHTLTGHRRTTFVRVTRYAEEKKNDPQKRLWGELLPTRANWFAVAARRIESGETPDWKLLLSNDVNQMSVNELLFSYMLAAYLIEAHPDKLADILKDIGTNKASADVLQAALGMPLARMESRLYRWVREHGRG